MAQSLVPRGGANNSFPYLYFLVLVFFFYVLLCEMCVMSHLLTSQKVFHIECNICLKNLYQYL